jgi:hypothetical protein
VSLAIIDLPHAVLRRHLPPAPQRHHRHTLASAARALVSDATVPAPDPHITPPHEARMTGHRRRAKVCDTVASAEISSPASSISRARPLPRAMVRRWTW